MRTKAILSFLLIAAGTCLLFLGACECLDSRLGQWQAAREFREVAGSTSAAAPPDLPQPGDTFAKLTIPRLGVQLYIVEGDGAAELRRGPGHMSGTAMPGDPGNCVIAGHRDTHFRIFKNIRKGDDIVLETRRGVFTYRVRATRVVSPRNTSAVEPTAGAELNLITCFPFYYAGAAPKRFVVEARLASAAAASSVRPYRKMG
jgi:sortase A